MEELMQLAFLEVTEHPGWDTYWWAEWAEQVSIYFTVIHDTKPDLCPKCRQGVSDCATFGCNLCDICGSPEDDHIPNISEAGPICPGQLEDLDIFIETEED